MIDRIRVDIEERLHELLAEVEKLRGALAALDGDGGAGGRSTRSGTASSARRASARPSGARARRRQREGGSRSSDMAASAQPVRGRAGGTKRAVMAALSGGEAMTAGEVAAATGLGRASVSTTLSKLSKTGEVGKADRGYRIAGRSTAGTARAEK